MAFDDLLSSAKGPGVIGMLLALFVLIGFGTLFMFAFDEGKTGEKSLAAQIRDSESEITSTKARIAEAEKKLATIPALKMNSAKLMETDTRNDFLEARITQRKTEIEDLKSGLTSVEEEFEDYKNQYRAKVRNEAAGTKIDELITLSGEVYKEVDIRKVTSVGIEVRHRDGHKRIGFEVLPEEMQDYYQFDKDQMIAEMKRETKVRQRHNAAVAVANEAAEEKAAERREEERKEAKQKAIRLVASKEASLQVMEREIRQLQSELVSAESAAEAARAAGRMHLSKAGQIRNRIASKRAAYSRLQAEIARMRSAL